MNNKFRTVPEVLEDPNLSIKQKAKRLVHWALYHVKGQGVQSTVHYTGEDIDEFAVPVSELERIEKELLEVIGNDR